MTKTLVKEDLENRLDQALMWLGFRDIEFNKRFSTNKFEEGKTGEEVYETDISYSSKDNLLPDKAATILIKLLENVMDYHIKKIKDKGELELTDNNN